MSDEDVWDFAGDDDAKVTIRAAIAIYSRVLPAAPAAILCRRSFRSCARSQARCRPSSRILWMMGASWRAADPSRRLVKERVTPPRL
jgi:hypothetical protein